MTDECEATPELSLRAIAAARRGNLGGASSQSASGHRYPTESRAAPGAEPSGHGEPVEPRKVTRHGRLLRQTHKTRVARQAKESIRPETGLTSFDRLRMPAGVTMSPEAANLHHAFYPSAASTCSICSPRWPARLSRYAWSSAMSWSAIASGRATIAALAAFAASMHIRTAVRGSSATS